MALSLESITRNTSVAPPRTLLYGVQGIGKTTFAAAMPSPIFIPTEDGLGRLDVNAFPLMQSYGQVVEALALLYNETHEYKSIVIDSADWLEPLVWEHTCTMHDWQDIEKPGFGKGYVAALDQWRPIFAWLDALRNHKRFNIMIIAHSQVKRFDSPEVEPFDRYEVKLHKGASAMLQEWADNVLFANYKVYTTESEVGFNKTVTRGIGAGERCLYTGERPAYRAKNRYQLPHEMPFDWATLEAAIHQPIQPIAIQGMQPDQAVQAMQAADPLYPPQQTGN